MEVKFRLFFAICICLLLTVGLCDPIKNQNKVRSTQMDYSGAQVIRVVPKNQNQLNYLRSIDPSLNVRFWRPPTKVGKPVDVMVKPSSRSAFTKQLQRRHIRRRTLIPDVGKKVKETQNYGIRRRSLLGGFFSDFQRLDAIYKFLDEIVSQNPKIASIITTGKSFEKREIRLIRIGVNHSSKTTPIIYIDGGIHAREWAAVSTACYIIDQLMKEYNAGQQTVKNFLTKYNFYITPVVNPDGYEYTHTNDRMWRKNRAANEGTQCIGTDLNRNFDYHFGEKGSSHDPCDEIYCGPSAFSEPESIAVKKLVLANKDYIKAFITLHAYGQYFLYPWGWSKANAPTAKELNRVANIAAKALYDINKTKYTVGSAAQVLYESQGSDDWAYGAAKIPLAFTLEMRDTGTNGFLLPPSQIEPTGQETYIAIKALVAAISDSRKRTQKLKNKNKRKAKQTKSSRKRRRQLN